MKFTRLNENAIRCVISQQEMSDFGVNIDDLMVNREKAEGFLRVILDEAKTEVDFQANGEALNVQLSVMPDGDISLMICDDQNMAIRAMLEQFKDKLKSFSDYLLMEKDRLNGKSQPEIKPYKPIPFDETSDGAKVVDEAAEDDPLQMTLWSEFYDLEDCIRLSKSLTHLGDVESDLFKFEDMYYLSVKMVQTKKQMAHNVFAVAEYSRQLFYDANLEIRLQEHGTPILLGHALKDLQAL